MVEFANRLPFAASSPARGIVQITLDTETKRRIIKTMKITALGRIPQVKVFPVTCGYCSTQFEFTESEAKFNNDLNPMTNCPLCGKLVIGSAEVSAMREESELGGHNALVTYILRNYDNLPKSTFNDNECVIFDCVSDDDYGYGNHSYEGYGVNREGQIVHATSGGCSCQGSCCAEPYTIDFTKEDSLKFDNYTPEEIKFDSLQVSFSDY